jgi:hypothetical protein
MRAQRGAEFLHALVEIPKMCPELKRSESLTMMASKASYNALAREILADMLYEEDTKAAQFAHGYAVGRGALPAPV